jgi:hypothetical protein
MQMKLCVSLLIMRLGGQDFRVYSSKKSPLMFPLLVPISALVLAALLLVPSVSTAALTRDFSWRGGARNYWRFRHARLMAQDDSTADEEAIPTGQVDKYIAVYSAMQKNHSLSVEQAASKQGLTVDEFRTLEDKIERNPVVHERVLDALKTSATGKKAAPGKNED